eukprot:scaffold4497_cov34-Tisochrysis_lutea.AAC.3
MIPSVLQRGEERQSGVQVLTEMFLEHYTREHCGRQPKLARNSAESLSGQPAAHVARSCLCRAVPAHAPLGVCDEALGEDGE